MISTEGDLWLVHDLNGKRESAFFSESAACQSAELLAGNRSASRPASDMILYGDGTGNTTVMVRRFPRSWFLDARLASAPLWSSTEIAKAEDEDDAEDETLACPGTAETGEEKLEDPADTDHYDPAGYAGEDGRLACAYCGEDKSVHVVVKLITVAVQDLPVYCPDDDEDEDDEDDGSAGPAYLDDADGPAPESD